MTRLYFVRHGESVANIQKQFAGSLDVPLTEKGRKQAEATALYLSAVVFSKVYASDLLRAFETGAIIASNGNVPIEKTPLLREIFAGEWEGKTYDQLDAEYADSYGVWRHQIGLAVCPHGESVAELQRRVQSFIAEVVKRHVGENVCIATHATPIRALECFLTNTPLEKMHTIPWVSNASVTIVEYEEDGHGTIVQRDQHEHLGALHTVLAKNV